VDARAERWQKRFELPVLIAALLVIPLIALEQSDVGEPWRTVAVVLNWSTWLVFALEAVVMIALARWAWIRTHPLDFGSTSPSSS
jgi:voltage-gated potassium channel